MMSLALMMRGFATFYGKHRIIANEMSNIIMRSITSYRRQAMHHEKLNKLWYNQLYKLEFVGQFIFCSH